MVTTILIIILPTITLILFSLRPLISRWVLTCTDDSVLRRRKEINNHNRKRLQIDKIYKHFPVKDINLESLHPFTRNRYNRKMLTATPVERTASI